MIYPGEFNLGDSYKRAHLSSIIQSEENTLIMCNWANKPHHIFYFCGNVGTGKTYFAAAWYNALKEKNKNVRIFTEHDLFSCLMDVMNRGWDPHKELKNWCECDYFILDDLGSSKPSEWKQEITLAFLNNRFDCDKPTLITSNLSKHQIQSLYHERTQSRLYAAKNTIIELVGEDRRQWKPEENE